MVVSTYSCAIMPANRGVLSITEFDRLSVLPLAGYLIDFFTMDGFQAELNTVMDGTIAGYGLNTAGGGEKSVSCLRSQYSTLSEQPPAKG